MYLNLLSIVSFFTPSLIFLYKFLRYHLTYLYMFSDKRRNISINSKPTWRAYKRSITNKWNKFNFYKWTYRNRFNERRNKKSNAWFTFPYRFVLIYVYFYSSIASLQDIHWQWHISVCVSTCDPLKNEIKSFLFNLIINAIKWEIL